MFISISSPDNLYNRYFYCKPLEWSELLAGSTTPCFYALFCSLTNNARHQHQQCHEFRSVLPGSHGLVATRSPFFGFVEGGIATQKYYTLIQRLHNIRSCYLYSDRSFTWVIGGGIIWAIIVVIIGYYCY